MPPMLVCRNIASTTLCSLLDTETTKKQQPPCDLTNPRATDKYTTTTLIATVAAPAASIPSASTASATAVAKGSHYVQRPSSTYDG